MDDDGYPIRRVVFRAEGGDSLSLDWLELDESERVDWTLTTRRSGEVEKMAGRYPAAKPSDQIIEFAVESASKPKPATIRPKGKLVAQVFGWTLFFGVFVLIRVVAVSVPPAAWNVSSRFDSDQAFTTAQQLANYLALSDLPHIVVGTLINQPSLGFLLAALTTLAFIVVSMPWLSLGSDTVQWRGVGMIAVLAISAGGALTLTPFPWSIAVGLLILGQIWAAWFGWTIDWQLSRALRLARKVRLRANRASTVVAEAGDSLTLHELADHLQASASRVQRAIWKSREKALEKPKNERAYFEARLTAALLRQEIRAEVRRDPATLQRLRRWARWDDRMFELRHRLTGALPFLIGAVLLLLAGAPVPWTAATCLTHGEEKATAYIVSESPAAYLRGDSRDLVVPGQWDGYSRSPGACPHSG